MPTFQLNAEDTLLNTTAFVPLDVWQAPYNVLYSTQREGTLINRYGSVFADVGVICHVNALQDSNVGHRVRPSNYHFLDGCSAILWSTPRQDQAVHYLAKQRCNIPCSLLAVLA